MGHLETVHLNKGYTGCPDLRHMLLRHSPLQGMFSVRNPYILSDLTHLGIVQIVQKDNHNTLTVHGLAEIYHARS